jgi:hypothetical protein
MDISKYLIARTAVGDVVSTPFDLCDLLAGRPRRLWRSRSARKIKQLPMPGRFRGKEDRRTPCLGSSHIFATTPLCIPTPELPGTTYPTNSNGYRCSYVRMCCAEEAAGFKLCSIRGPDFGSYRGETSFFVTALS